MSERTRRQVEDALLDLLDLLTSDPNPDWADVHSRAKVFTGALWEAVEDDFLYVVDKAEMEERRAMEFGRKARRLIVECERGERHRDEVYETLRDEMWNDFAETVRES